MKEYIVMKNINIINAYLLALFAVMKNEASYSMVRRVAT